MISPKNKELFPNSSQHLCDSILRHTSFIPRKIRAGKFKILSLFLNTCSTYRMRVAKQTWETLTVLGWGMRNETWKTRTFFFGPRKGTWWICMYECSSQHRIRWCTHSLALDGCILWISGKETVPFRFVTRFQWFCTSKTRENNIFFNWFPSDVSKTTRNACPANIVRANGVTCFGHIILLPPHDTGQYDPIPQKTCNFGKHQVDRRKTQLKQSRKWRKPYFQC